jgi:hypothetical protein
MRTVRVMTEIRKPVGKRERLDDICSDDDSDDYFDD